jgi:hypothetical protein
VRIAALMRRQIKPRTLIKLCILMRKRTIRKEALCFTGSHTVGPISYQSTVVFQSNPHSPGPPPQPSSFLTFLPLRGNERAAHHPVINLHFHEDHKLLWPNARAFACCCNAVRTAAAQLLSIVADCQLQFSPFLLHRIHERRLDVQHCSFSLLIFNISL